MSPSPRAARAAGFLIPIAYLGILGFNETAAQLVNKQPRYDSDSFPDGRTPLSNMITDYWWVKAEAAWPPMHVSRAAGAQTLLAPFCLQVQVRQ